MIGPFLCLTSFLEMIYIQYRLLVQQFLDAAQNCNPHNNDVSFYRAYTYTIVYLFVSRCILSVL